MAEYPLVSIVLPVWNGQKYLAEAIESILAQSFTSFELIIVNDCSTDKSAEIAQAYATKDSRVRLITNEQNLKLPRSLNRGFAKTKGRYFTWTSDDNRMLPDCLQILYDGCVSSGADFVYSRYLGIDENGQRLSLSVDIDALPPPLESLLYANVIGASFLYKNDVHKALDGYNPDLFLVEDYDFWVRAYLKGFTFQFIAATPYEYRVHNASLTGQHRIQSVLIPFLYRIRNQFPRASRNAHFRNRSYLLTEGIKYLSLSQRLLVLCESLYHSPLATCKGLLKHLARKISAPPQGKA